MRDIKGWRVAAIVGGALYIIGLTAVYCLLERDDRLDAWGLLTTSAVGVIALVITWQQANAERQTARVAQAQLELETLRLAERDWFRGPISQQVVAQLGGSLEQSLSTVAQVRSLALSAYDGSPDKWPALTVDGQPWNAYVYDGALRLQHAGLAAFMGAASLRTLLALFGSTIAEDWMMVEAHVDAIRTANGEGKVPVRRRHAEWLGLVAICWAAKREPNHLRLGAWSRNHEKFTGALAVASRIRQLTKAEPEGLLGVQTARELRTLIGVDPRQEGKDTPMEWFDVPVDPSATRAVSTENPRT